MPSQVFLVEFKNSPAAQADDKSENPSYYFHYEISQGKFNLIELERIIPLLTAIYPATSFFTDTLVGVKGLVYANYHFEASSYFTHVNKHMLVTKTPDCHEIYTDLTIPPAKELQITTKLIDDFVPPAIDSKMLDQALQQRLFTNKVTRLDLLAPAPAPKMVKMDEMLFPPAAVLANNENLFEQVDNQAVFLNESCEQIQNLFMATDEIKKRTQAEYKEFEILDNEFETLSIEYAANKFTNHSKIKFTDLKTKLEAQYQTLIANPKLEEIRLALLHCLRLSAVAYFQKELKNISNETTAAKFNEQFSNIAKVEITDSKPVLRFINNLFQLNFTELQNLVQQMFVKFYKYSSWAPWGYSYPKSKFDEYLNLEQPLSTAIMFHPSQDSFAWAPFTLRNICGYDYRDLIVMENAKLNSDLTNQNKKLTLLAEQLAELEDKVAALKLKAEQDEAKLKKGHAQLGNVRTEAKQNTQAMMLDYMRLPDQTAQLHQTILNLVKLSATLNMPYAGLANLIAEATELESSIALHKEIADLDPHNLEKVGAAAIQVEALKKELVIKFNSFNDTIKPLHELTTVATALEAKLNSQHSTTIAKDNLISVTRKFANMLMDVKYFSSLVSWGGVGLTVNGITYTVPTSYLKLFVLAKSLVEPIKYDNALAFWNQAKIYESEAQQRGSHRFFFYRVRSKEMSLLQDLIRGLKIESSTFADDVDGKLSQIKSDWRLNMEHRTIPVQPDVSSLSSKNSRRRGRYDSSLFPASSSSASASSTASVDPGSFSLTASSLSNRS